MSVAMWILSLALSSSLSYTLSLFILLFLSFPFAACVPYSLLSACVPLLGKKKKLVYVNFNINSLPRLLLSGCHLIIQLIYFVSKISEILIFFFNLNN